jgi:hypothetical protein
MELMVLVCTFSSIFYGYWLRTYDTTGLFFDNAVVV